MVVLLLAMAGIVAGGIAAVAGFGIGSLLTPALALQTGTKLAVAAVAIPHVVGTAQRFLLLRRHVDWQVVRSFGITSAVGGLTGALLQARASSRALEILFGTLLILAGVSELSGWMQRVRWSRTAAWIAGAVSGFLGGLVGNQGGIRSAAMLGYDVPKQSFVATATAIALLVDAARLPIYLVNQGAEIARIAPHVLIVTGGVVVGTYFGNRILIRLSQIVFRRVVALLLLALGVYMLAGSIRITRGGTNAICSLEGRSERGRYYVCPDAHVLPRAADTARGAFTAIPNSGGDQRKYPGGDGGERAGAPLGARVPARWPDPGDGEAWTASPRRS